MRVITGEARGRKLKTLAGDDVVRPTTDKVKEALFSIVHFELENALVLDAFAGCGQLGIEALSRGANRVYFIDKNRTAAETVKENLQSTNLADRAVVLQADAFSFVQSTQEKFDIVLLDPPYNKGLVAKMLPLLSSCCKPGALVVCETAFMEELPETAGDFSLLRVYKYSKTKLTTYRKHEENE